MTAETDPIVTDPTDYIGDPPPWSAARRAKYRAAHQISAFTADTFVLGYHVDVPCLRATRRRTAVGQRRFGVIMSDLIVLATQADGTPLRHAALTMGLLDDLAEQFRVTILFRGLTRFARITDPEGGVTVCTPAKYYGKVPVVGWMADPLDPHSLVQFLVLGGRT